MKIAAVSAPRFEWVVSKTRLSDFVTLMKPRVMILGCLHCIRWNGDSTGPSRPTSCVSCHSRNRGGAGAAGVLNMWYDADIDALMRRTAMRPIPRGAVSRREALAFGLVLAAGSVAVLASPTNMKAAALLAFTMLFYVVVYTVWLKRRTPQNIVIGGAAGALPPVIGWAAATGDIGLEPLVLFLIIFLWTPPHFWALSLNRSDEYARAGVPMLPVVAGRAATKRQILVYSVLLVFAFDAALGAGICRCDLWRNCSRLGSDLRCTRVAAQQERRGRSAGRPSPLRVLHRYLFVLFAALLVSTQSIGPLPACRADRPELLRSSPLKSPSLRHHQADEV